jgi:nucleolar MIF4G domain-containing protein 1
LEELLLNVFVSTQLSTPMIPPNWREAVTTRDRTAIDAVFVKAARIQILAMGLVYFISHMSGSREADGLVKWAIEIAKDTLRATVEV